MLGDVDKQVLLYTKALRDAASVANRKIIIVAALGIIHLQCPSLLAEHGGPFDLTAGNARSWCESFAKRANLVKRKSTKAAKKLPGDFP